MYCKKDLYGWLNCYVNEPWVNYAKVTSNASSLLTRLTYLAKSILNNRKRKI